MAAIPSPKPGIIREPSSIPSAKSDFKTESNSPDNLLLYFSRTPLEQISPRPTTGTISLWKDFDIVGFQNDEKIPRIFAKLVTEGFLSGPVLDESRKYKDVIDMLDLVTFTLEQFSQLGLEWTDANWQSFMESERKFVDATADDVLKFHSQRPRTYATYRGTSLLQALSVFANTNIRRIPVVSRQDRVVGMVTQSMVVSLLTQNLNLLGSLKDKRVGEMESILAPQEKLLFVKENQTAVEAFKIMTDNNISGLPILDNNGLLVDSISIRDLRVIGTNAARWRRLHQSVKEFKEIARQEFPAQTPQAPITVTANDTIQTIIEKMDDGNIHRVFLAEPANGGKFKCKAVISQGDLLRFIAKETGVALTFGEEEAVDEKTTGRGAAGGPEAMELGTPRARSDSTDTDVDMNGGGKP
jgi:CBS domain-containing protein